MEEVLNVIVDSITSVLLVLEDAQATTNRKLTVSTTEQLGKAVDVLVDLAVKAAATYNDESKEKMHNVITSMRSSSENESRSIYLTLQARYCIASLRRQSNHLTTASSTRRSREC